MSNTIKLKRGSGSDPSASDLSVGEIAIRTDSGKLFTKKDNGAVAEISGSGGIDDGDKGDITVSNGGDTFTIDNGVVTTAKIASQAITTGLLAGECVTSAKIADGTITNFDINASAAIAGSKINPLFTTNLTVSTTNPKVFLTDTNSNSDYFIQNDDGTFKIIDDTNSDAVRYQLGSDGTHYIYGNANVMGTSNLTVGGNLDVDGTTELDGLNVTGDITGTGDLTLTSTDAGSDASPIIEFYRNSASPADADYLGQLKFTGESDDGSKETYAKVTGKIDDASSGTEDGLIEFMTRKAGSKNICARLTSTDLKLINGTGLEVAGDITGSSNLTGVKSIQASGHATIAGTPHTYKYGRGGEAGGLSIYATEGAIEAVGSDSSSHSASLLLRTTVDGAGFVYNPTDNALELKLFTTSANDFAIHGSGTNVSDIETQLRVVKDAQVELAHNGSVKLATSSSGIDITGSIVVSGTVDGVDIAARNTLFGGLTSSSGVLTNGVTATTQSATDNSSKVATTAYTDTAISNLVDSSPSALNTLNELAAALGDDANFSTTVTNSIATKMPLAGGQFTGNITFSGSQTVDGRDLSVDGAKLDTIESNATADQTASEILTLIKTVDGAGSGLDADTLDGISSASFVRSDANDAISGFLTITNDSGLRIRSSTNAVGAKINFSDQVSSYSQNGTLTYKHQDGHITTTGGSSNDGWVFEGSETRTVVKVVGDIEATSNIYGAGANITALNASNITSGTIPAARVPTLNQNTTGSAATLTTARTIAGVSFDGSANISLNNNAITNGAGYITSADGGNAAMVDGLDSTSFLRADADDSFTGTLTGTSDSTNPVILINGGGPNFIRFDSNDGTASDSIDLIYRTSPNTLAFERVSDAQVMFSVDADNQQALFAGNLDVGAGLDVTGNISCSGTVDGRDLATDGSKLDGIASGATNVTNTNQLTNGAGFITATLTNEQVQDIVGGMVSSNTESGITVTYQDGDGTLDFAVASQTDNNFTNADHSKLDGIEAGATADQSASEILTLIKTVDGAGSGLDADTLDGISSASFLRSDANDTVANNLNFTSTTTPITTNSIKFNNSEMSSSYYTDATGVLAFDENFSTDSQYGTGATSPMSTFTSNGGGLVIKNEDGWGAVLSSTNIQYCEGNFANLKINSNQVFHAGNLSVGDGGLTSNNFTDSDHSKLNGIESGATADQSNSEIKTAYESNSNTNAFTDALLSKLNGIAASATNVTNNNQLTNGAGYLTSVGTSNITNNAVTLDKVQDIDQNRIIGRVASGSGDLQILTAASVRTMINVADGATNVTNNNQISNGAGYVTSSVINSLNASNLSSGTIPDARFPSTLPAVDGSNLTGISAGATGGGSDEVFYENDQTVTTNYTITNGKNAMAAGPITINSGVTVTVGSGETLTIV